MFLFFTAQLLLPCSFYDKASQILAATFCDNFAKLSTGSLALLHFSTAGHNCLLSTFHLG